MLLTDNCIIEIIYLALFFIYKRTCDVAKIKSSRSEGERKTFPRSKFDSMVDSITRVRRDIKIVTRNRFAIIRGATGR